MEMVQVVAWDPRPDLYRGVGEASQILLLFKRSSVGKGLTYATDKHEVSKKVSGDHL